MKNEGIQEMQHSGININAKTAKKQKYIWNCAECFETNWSHPNFNEVHGIDLRNTCMEGAKPTEKASNLLLNLEQW